MARIPTALDVEQVSLQNTRRVQNIPTDPTAEAAAFQGLAVARAGSAIAEIGFRLREQQIDDEVLKADFEVQQQLEKEVQELRKRDDWEDFSSSMRDRALQLYTERGKSMGAPRAQRAWQARMQQSALSIQERAGRIGLERGVEIARGRIIEAEADFIKLMDDPAFDSDARKSAFDLTMARAQGARDKGLIGEDDVASLAARMQAQIDKVEKQETLSARTMSEATRILTESNGDLVRQADMTAALPAELIAPVRDEINFRMAAQRNQRNALQMEVADEIADLRTKGGRLSRAPAARIDSWRARAPQVLDQAIQEERARDHQSWARAQTYSNAAKASAFDEALLQRFRDPGAFVGVDFTSPSSLSRFGIEGAIKLQQMQGEMQMSAQAPLERARADLIARGLEVAETVMAGEGRSIPSGRDGDMMRAHITRYIFEEVQAIGKEKPVGLPEVTNIARRAVALTGQNETIAYTRAWNNARRQLISEGVRAPTETEISQRVVRNSGESRSQFESGMQDADERRDNRR